MNETQVQALIDLRSEINAIHPSFAKQLGLLIRPTDVEAQKIDGTALNTHEIVAAALSVVDKANRVRFFEKTFLVANVSLEVVLGMPFLILSSVDIDFLGQKLWWRTYTTKKSFPTIGCIKLVGKKEFAVTALDPEHKTYIVHVVSFSSIPLVVSLGSIPLDVHPFWRPQISGLIAEEASTKIPDKYANFADIFFLDLASKLPEHTGINNHTIKPVDNQQPPYELINSLGPAELESLKANIETNLANGFIRLSMSPTGTPILFNQKSDSFFQLCVNYRGLNKLTIKNWYPLLLIRESLDRLERARWFIQLDLTSIHHLMIIREGDEWKTVFRTWYGHFEYQVIPFGLTNAPASFQRFINKIFVEKLDIFVIVYLDDILIYTDNDRNGYIAAIS